MDKNKEWAWAVYEVLPFLLMDDKGNTTDLQFEAGPFTDKSFAVKEAERLSKTNFAIFQYKVLPY